MNTVELITVNNKGIKPFLLAAFDNSFNQYNNCYFLDARSQPRFRVNELDDKVKKNRIMDLQLECLEIKKYTMQMEALMLEHQLNLPRSVYTETLERSSSVTRGTQTDIGGNNTKVFYVSDSEGTRLNSQHFFSFQSRTDE